MSALALTDAPDFASPLEAWRAWRVVYRDGEYLLGSIVKPALWPWGESLRADCLHRRLPVPGRRGQRHAAPDSTCECGIYAAGLTQIGQYLGDLSAPFVKGMRPTVARVLGRVSLWGTVIECERGYRASHAYPLEIFVPVDGQLGERHGWDELAEGLAPYGVPLEPLAARCIDATTVLARRFPVVRPTPG